MLHKLLNQCLQQQLDFFCFSCFHMLVSFLYCVPNINTHIAWAWIKILIPFTRTDGIYDDYLKMNAHCMWLRVMQYKNGFSVCCSQKTFIHFIPALGNNKRQRSKSSTWKLHAGTTIDTALQEVCGISFERRPHKHQ